MYSKEEAKKLRLEFWDRFANYTSVRRRQKGLPARFIMNKTGIKQLKLKFHFDDELASVGIDIETRNTDRRIQLFDKLEELKSLMDSAINQDIKWELEHILPTGKSISRISVEKKGVNIYDKETWPEVFPFFYKTMMKFENFFIEFKDILKEA